MTRFPNFIKCSILLPLCLTLTSLLLFGCGRGAPPAPTPIPVSLSFITLDDDFAAEVAVIKAFEAEHPHIQIKRQVYNQLPQQYLVADSPPDVMLIGPSHILLSAGQAGLLTDLTDLWNQAGLIDNYPASFRAMSEADGKQYFLPMAYSWAGFYYNQAIFDELNLTPPETWSEFMLLLDTLQTNGITPLAIAGESPFSTGMWFEYLNSRLNGPAFHSSLLRGQASYLDVRVETVMALWAQLVGDGYALPGIERVNDFDAITAILDGPNGPLTSQRAAMVLADPLALTSVPQALRNQPGFFPFPMMDGEQVRGESMLLLGYMVPASAPHVEAAIEFLSYMSQAAVQDQLYRPSESNLSYAPVRASDPSDYSAEVQHRMAVILEADQVELPYFLGSPPTMQLTLAGTLATFLRQAEDKQVNLTEILQQLEDAREAALAQGEFIE